MSADVLLSRLDKVRRTGAGRWVARCPAHDDRGPSLAVRELDDGRVLLHCFAGCDVEQVLATVGLELQDLFPERLGEHLRAERRPFPAADVLRCLAYETMVVSVAGVSVAEGNPLTPEDRERLVVAVMRIQAGMAAAGVEHHG